MCLCIFISTFHAASSPFIASAINASCNKDAELSLATCNTTGVELSFAFLTGEKNGTLGFSKVKYSLLLPILLLSDPALSQSLKQKLLLQTC